MGANAGGFRRERELVSRLHDQGFQVVRAAPEASDTEREQPDLLAGNGHDVYAIEAEAGASSRIYLDREEVEVLVDFARKFGAKARIGVCYNESSWRFLHPRDLRVTEGGNYRSNRQDALERGYTIEEL